MQNTVSNHIELNWKSIGGGDTASTKATASASLLSFGLCLGSAAR